MRYLFRSHVLMRTSGLLSIHAGEEFGADDIAALIGADRSSVAKALGYLEADGFVAWRAVGKKHLYQAVTSHPLFPEIRSIAIKSFGGQSEILAAITGDAKVLFAAIHGSFARGAETERSDIDVLFVIADEEWEQEDYALATAMAGVSDTIARPVHASIYAATEFARLRATGNEMLQSILSSPMIMLKGEIGDV